MYPYTFNPYGGYDPYGIAYWQEQIDIGMNSLGLMMEAAFDMNDPVTGMAFGGFAGPETYGGLGDILFPDLQPSPFVGPVDWFGWGDVIADPAQSFIW